jgi:hypothetical protein
MTLHSLKKTPRLKGAARKKPYFETVAPSVSLGYRRNQGAGSWVVRAADGKGGNWTKAFAAADDLEVANDDTVMSYEQACDRARKLARGTSTTVNTDPPLTVFEAIGEYKKDLILRKASKYNATQIRRHMNPQLGGKSVALTVSKDFSDWRDGLILAGLEISSADRHGRSLKAALNLQAMRDKRISNSAEWRTGLAKLKADGENARCVILENDVVASIVRSAYQHRKYGDLIGVWCHLLSDTGARESQCRRLQVIDLQISATGARLMMPSSNWQNTSRRQDGGRDRQTSRTALQGS